MVEGAVPCCFLRKATRSTFLEERSIFKNLACILTALAARLWTRCASRFLSQYISDANAKAPLAEYLRRVWMLGANCTTFPLHA